MTDMRKLLPILSLVLVLIACTGVTPNDPDVKVATEMQKSPKRGACFSFDLLEDLPLMTPAISWWYNWGDHANEMAAYWLDNYGIDFCPMCWKGNFNADRIREYVKAHPNTKYLLAYNEPNLKDQANMTPSEAAVRWPEIVALARELNLKIVSPAMNYGTVTGYGDPIKWMDEFLAQPQVNLDDIHAISLHCYMASADAVRSFIDLFDKYNKVIWLTEFCAWESTVGKVENQMDYMNRMLNYLEQTDKIERYSWFMPRTNSIPDDAYPFMQLLTHDFYHPELTKLGKMYLMHSSFDKSVYLDLRSKVYLYSYVGLSRNAITARVSTDDENKLMVGASEDDWMDYQVYANSKLSKLQLRYSSGIKSVIAIDVDGRAGEDIQLESTGFNVWNTVSVPVKMSAGKHTIRFRVVKGGVDLGWISSEAK